MPSPKSLIGNVTAHYPSRIDVTTARRRVTHLLQNANVTPSGLAPQSILIVHSVCVSAPLLIASGRIGPDWERGIRAAVADFGRRAVRPERGRIPRDAEAILFLDDSEMLACLSMDLVRQVAWDRWWWRSILNSTRAIPASSMLAMQFCLQSRAVPGALGHLAAWGCANEIIQTLTPPQAEEILTAVCADYGLTLPSGRGPTSPVAVPYRSRDQNSAGEALPTRRSQPGQHIGTGSPPAPWEAWIPHEAIPVETPRELACLLGVGLALLRAPSLARSREFAAGLAQWWEARAETESRGSRRSAPVAGDQTSAATPRREADTAPLTVSELLRPSSIERGKRSGAAAEEAAGATAAVHSPGANAEEIAGATTLADITLPVLTRGKPDIAHRDVAEVGPLAGAALLLERTGRRHADSSDDLADKAKVENWGLTPVALADGVVTRLGGMLYLVNLMRHFDLPGSFEEEWALAERVGAWGVLEALARGLIGLDAPAAEPDPIWQALALLNGREPGARLGAALPASARFHLPPGWLEESLDDARGRSVIHWAAGSRTLRLWAAEGYLLVETPRSALSAELQARDELGAYAALAASAELVRSPLRAAPIRLPRALRSALAPALAAWLARALPFLRQRLLRALNAENEESDPVSLLLRAPGRIHITAMHIDMVLPLDAISIPARMAGLDRDPGWMPDFGRIILFHFE